MDAPKRDVGVVGPVNGMNERHPKGSYFRLALFRGDNEDHQEFLISTGGAEFLAETISAILAKKKEPPMSTSEAPVAFSALVKALEDAPRPTTSTEAADQVPYMDWFFKVRIAALAAARSPNEGRG